MSPESSNRYSWKDAPQWFRVTAFVGAVAVSISLAVELGGTRRMEPWLLLVFAMLAGRVAHYLLPATQR